MGRKQVNCPVLHFALKLCFALLIIFGCNTAQSQLFEGHPSVLQTCKVVKAGLDGQPSSVKCGARLYRVITQGQAIECAGWSQDCPRWEERSRLLDRSQAELQTCLIDASDAERQVVELVDMNRLLHSDLDKQRRLSQSRWTTLEIVGVAAISVTAGLLGGFAAGAYAF